MKRKKLKIDPRETIAIKGGREDNELRSELRRGDQSGSRKKQERWVLQNPKEQKLSRIDSQAH